MTHCAHYSRGRLCRRCKLLWGISPRRIDRRGNSRRALGQVLSPWYILRRNTCRGCRRHRGMDSPEVGWCFGRRLWSSLRKICSFFEVHRSLLRSNRSQRWSSSSHSKGEALSRIGSSRMQLNHLRWRHLALLLKIDWDRVWQWARRGSLSCYHYLGSKESYLWKLWAPHCFHSKSHRST